MTQTVTSGRRRAPDARVHQQHPVLLASDCHTLPSRRSLRATAVGEVGGVVSERRSTVEALHPIVVPTPHASATPVALVAPLPLAAPAASAVRPASGRRAAVVGTPEAETAAGCPEAEIPAQPFPTRRQLRSRADAATTHPAPAVPLEAVRDEQPDVPLMTPPAGAEVPDEPTQSRRERRHTRPHGAGAHRNGNRNRSGLARLRDQSATAGMVLASAGLLMGTVAASTTAAAPAAPEPAAVVTAGAAAPAVTAPSGAEVAFRLESAGPVTDGIAPSTASARALSASVSPVVQEREAFAVPVAEGSVASTFGHRVNPMGGYGTELHTGLDYASACGTPVTAADDGTVVEAGWHAYGGGQRIVVDHGDGMQTSYNHLSVIDVAPGAAVSRGAALGAVGSTGNSTGCHLHFEVMVDDEKVDPQPWL